MDYSNRILFEKPDLAELTKQHLVVDMHFHTNYSDGTNKVEAVVNKARSLGIGVAITDHNTIKGAVEIDTYNDIITIPGIEITSIEGTHILLYFYDIEDLKKFYHHDIKPHLGNDVMSSISLTMEEIIISARSYQSIIIFPHPYCAAYTEIFNLNFPETRLNQLFDITDGVEAINSESLKKWNLRSTVC